MPGLRQRPAQLAARTDPELAEYVAQVPFDRAGGQKQLGADLDSGVCEITSAVFQASDLAGAKRREFLGAAREGQLAWLATFDEDDRAEFFQELRDALSVAAATRDAVPVETCLREWRTTAQALSDPLRRAILTAPGDDDYAEVDRPQE